MTDPGQAGSPTQVTTQYSLDLRWPNDTGARAQVVNKVLFAWSEGHDLVYMYLGHVAPPPWLSQEEADDRSEEIGKKLPVEPQGSFALTLPRAEELWEALGKHLGKKLSNAND